MQSDFKKYKHLRIFLGNELYTCSSAIILTAAVISCKLARMVVFDAISNQDTGSAMCFSVWMIPYNFRLFGTVS